MINPLKFFRLYLRNGTVQTCLYILLTSTKRKYSIYITPYCISVDLEGRFDRHETVKHISSMLQVFGVNFLQKWYRNLLYWKKKSIILTSHHLFRIIPESNSTMLQTYNWQYQHICFQCWKMIPELMINQSQNFSLQLKTLVVIGMF